MADERERVAAYWGNHDFTDHLARIHWMSSPVVRDYLNQLASGDPDLDWLRWAWGRFVVGGLPAARRRRGLSVLVLGCGTGWLDRFLVRQPGVASVDACDVAEEAVAQAREAARREGLEDRLRYHVVDLNREPPPGGPHDVAVAHSVLHHVEDLEHAYPALARSLAPDGLLILNEYVGPRRFQFTGEQMAAINGALIRLPERYRRSAMMPGAVFPHREVPTEAQMIATDPSESVRSDELLAFTRRHFRVLGERPYGGTVLQLLLYDVVQNFDPSSLPDARLQGLLCLLEEALMREGMLPSDYALVVARRREDGAIVDEAGTERRILRLDPGASRVPAAVPVRRTVARERGETPPPAPRRSIHSRPRRDLRHGWDLPPVRDHLHRLATGNPRTPWATWVLDELLPEVRGDRPSGRALLLDPRLDWLERAVAAVPGVDGVDVLEAVSPPGELPPSGEPSFRLRRGGDTASGAALPLSDLELPSGAWSLVFTNGWIGRAPDRAAFARRLVAALAPGGLLVGDEWLGPPDGRTTPRTLGYARQVVELLQPLGAPEPGALQWLRRHLVDLDHRLLGPSAPRRSPGAALAGGPSGGSGTPPHGGREGGVVPGSRDGLLSARNLQRPEGPLAEELADLLGPECPLLVLRPTGGALLQRVLPALEEPPQADAADRDAALAFVALAAWLEELLTRAGVLAPEYACFVAQRPRTA